MGARHGSTTELGETAEHSARVLISLLGETELYDETGGTLHIGGVRRRAVLAALALELNRTVAVERLLEIVWDERPPAQARAALQGHIAVLRRTLPDPLGVDTVDGGYRLTGDAGSVDTALFASLLERGTREPVDAVASRSLDAALRLWRGDALADLLSVGFFRSSSGTLREARAQAAELWAWRKLRMGQGALAVARIQSLLHEDPTRESLVRILMLCLDDRGHRAQALAVYQRAADRLHRELGMRPGPLLQDALSRVLRGDSCERSSVGAAPGTRDSAEALPPALSGFVGREPELQALDQLLEADVAGECAPARIAAVTGTAGAGKTGLLLRWGHRVRGRFPDGVLYADLRGTRQDPAPLTQVLRGFLGRLGVPGPWPDSEPELAGLFRESCRGRRLLVLLDDACADGSERLPAADGPGCVTVVASRCTPADLAVDRGALLVPVPPLSTADARRLLEIQLGADRLAGQEAVVDELIELCDRQPLALRSAAVRLALRPAWAVKELVASIGERIAVGECGFLQATVEALNATRRLLPPSAASLLTLLGTFAGRETDVERAAELLGTGAADARSALRNLAVWNLVHDRSPGRYTWSGLVALYARGLDPRTGSGPACGERDECGARRPRPRREAESAWACCSSAPSG